MEEVSFYNLLKYVGQNLEEDTEIFELFTENYNIKVGLSHYDGLTTTFKVRIFDKNNKKHMALVIKKPSTVGRRLRGINTCISREFNFYANIYPCLRTFEARHQVLKSFIPVSEFITLNLELGKEMLVLNDLECRNFRTASSLDENHCQLIFKTFGRFHAIVFCWRKENVEQFNNLTQSYSMNCVRCCVDQMLNNTQPILEEILDILLKRRIKVHLIQKLQLYLPNLKKLFMNVMNNEKEDICFVLGNYKLNNIMFKYNVSIKAFCMYIPKLLILL